MCSRTQHSSLVERVGMVGAELLRHPFELVNVDDQQLQVVDIFCYFKYLVYTICASGGSSASITTRCRTTWRKFRDNLPLLTNRGIPLHIRESIYTSYKCRVMLYGCKCWPLRKEEHVRLRRRGPCYAGSAA